MIYIVRSGDSPYVKIGYAEDVAERVKLLQCGNPEPLHLLRILEGDRATEGWLHRHFRERCIRAEWFTFSPDMLTVCAPYAHKVLISRPFVEKPSFSEAFDSCGKSRKQVSREIGRSQSCVSQWLTGQRAIPAEIIPATEASTGIPRHLLRPDLWEAPAELATT